MAEENGNAVVKLEVDTKKGLVKVGEKWLPTTPCNRDTVPRMMKREYDSQPVPIDTLIERFAGSTDDEEDVAWGLGKLNAIKNDMIGEDPCLVPIRAYGRTGRGQTAGYKLVSASDQDAMDQLVDRALRAQRRQQKAGERYERLQETAKKYGVTIA